MEIEKRFLEAREIRIEKVDEKPHLTGYALPFNTLSQDFGGWRERFIPSAFDNWLDGNNDIRAISQHDSAYPLARTEKDTLQVWTDEIGLRFDMSLPNTTFAHDLIASIEHGDIEGMSIGFIAKEDRWTSEGGIDIREVTEAILDHISPVTSPAYKATSVAVRSKEAYDEFKKSQQPEEKPEKNETETPLLNMASLKQIQKEAEHKQPSPNQ